MGYDFAAAFAPTLPRPKFFPPFEGLAVGFTNTKMGQSFKAGQALPPKYPTHKEVSEWPEVKAASLMHLRAKWLEDFLGFIGAFNPAIPIPWAVDWLDGSGVYPINAERLKNSMAAEGPRLAACLCANKWNTEGHGG